MKIALVYPPSFQAWAKEQSIPQPLYLSDLHFRVLAARSLHQGPDKQLTLAFPRDGDIFKLDPILSRRFQKILLRARAGGQIQSITWRINGRDIHTSAPPFTFFWQLQPGFYTLQAYASQNPRVHSQTVRFRVLP